MSNGPLTEGKTKGGSGAVKRQEDNGVHPIAPPPPPTPPEFRMECSSCGFTAVESEYQKNHPYCKSARTLIIILIVGVIVWLGFLGHIIWSGVQ